MTNNFKICVVVAQYYDDVAKNLIKGTNLVLDKQKAFKLVRTNIVVPGVFEIPAMIAKFINKYDAFIALGCVIKGETPHFDFISMATINEIMNLSVRYKKPILNGIITCLNKDQALERADPNKKDKGGESARSLIQLLGITENK